MTLVSISTFTVELLVAGKIEFMKVISEEIATFIICIYVSNHEMSCNVTKRGFYERLHCYDIDFPFYSTTELFPMINVPLFKNV